VEAYWLVAKEGRSIAMRKWVGICNNTIGDQGVWQCYRDVLVQDLRDEGTIGLTQALAQL